MKPSDALLDFGNPVAYYPGLVKYLGSVNAVLFFCQILHHKGKELFPDLGVYKTAQEIEEETGLTSDEQRTARRKLRELGVLIETERRIEHRIYYRLDLDVFNRMPNPEVGISQPGSGKSPHPELGISHSYTESTSEITAESKAKTLAESSVELPAIIRENAVFDLPMIDGSEWPVPQKLYAELVQAYPGVSVMAELSKLRMWLISNPKRRKTKSGLPRAINAWMSRTQNSSPTNGDHAHGRSNFATYQPPAVVRADASRSAFERALQRSGSRAAPAEDHGGSNALSLFDPRRGDRPGT